MKKFILIITFVFSIGFIDGQTTFFKTIGGYNESSRYIEQTTDGGYIIAGRSARWTSTNGYAVKTNSVGDTVWTKLYGGTSYAEFKSARQTNDGGYIFVGKIGTSTLTDVYVVKTDSFGTIQWQKIIGGSLSDVGTFIRQTSDGGYIITGYGKSYGAGGDDVFIIKLDSIGNTQWDNILGQSGLDQGYSIEETNDGGYVATGTYGVQTYLFKLSNLGIIQWTKTYSEAGFFYKGKSVMQTSDGGYLILGGRRDTSQHNVILIKTDSLGNINWSKLYNGANAGNSESYSFNKTQNGGVIISSYLDGYFSLLYILVDSSGNIVWSQSGAPTSGYTNYGTWAQQTNDGGYILTGYAIDTFGGGFIYLIKTDSLGRSGCNDTITTLIVNTIIPTINTITVSTTLGIATTTPSLLTSCFGQTITTYCTSVGINESPSTPQISVYPNPSSGQFNFNGLEKESKIEVFDMTGKIIYQSIANNDFETINISDKATGIYFYRITKEMKLVQSGKIALQ